MSTNPDADWPDAWLSRDPLPAEPFPVLAEWLREAFADGRQPSPHAVALATADADGIPSARMVLVQSVEPEDGAVVFFSHYDSPKGRELEARPTASVVFHFSAMGRQVRISGRVARIEPAESDAYFATRPVDSQIGAWASRQSQPLANRQLLLDAMSDQARRYGVSLDGPASDAVPRPPDWGGFRLRADRIELWCSRPGRAHDRAQWTRLPAGWQSQRLYP